MRILILHSRYLSGPASGENRVVDDEARLLAEAGHHVDVFAPPPGGDDGLEAIRAGLAAVWSRSAVAEVGERVRSHRPDLIHVHNLFPMLSPAVIRAAARGGVPVVMTLHNFRLLCLPATLLRHGEPCEACVGRLPWRGVVSRCYRGSAAASGALAGSLALHRAAGTFDRVGAFLAVSGFVRDKHLAAGFPPDRVLVKPNFSWPVPPRRGPGSYFLYLGRLSPEKGVDVLLRAWEGLASPLVVAGDGPEAARLRALAPRNVEFRGLVDPQAVPGLLRGARAVLVPSRAYEGAPRAILEAFAAGVGVVASRRGALPEHVDQDISGLLVEGDDAASWSAAVSRLADDLESLRLGAGALASWRARFSPERGLQALENAYRAVLDARRTAGESSPSSTTRQPAPMGSQTTSGNGRSGSQELRQ